MCDGICIPSRLLFFSTALGLPTTSWEAEGLLVNYHSVGSDNWIPAATSCHSWTRNLPLKMFSDAKGRGGGGGGYLQRGARISE